MNDSTTRLSPHATFWLVFLALALFALLLFSEILLPFAAGMVLAYLFHPLVKRMRRIGIHQGAAAFAVIAAIALVIAVILAIILPPVLEQLGELIRKFPSYIDRAKAYIDQHYGAYLHPIRQRVASPQQGGAPADASQQIVQSAVPWIVTHLQDLMSRGLSLFNWLALVFLTPVVTFFLLRDWDKMIASIEELIPRRDAPKIRELALEINSTISGYLRGTLIVLLIVSAFYMVSLGLIGLNYGLLIGLGAGLISFVPYLGSTTGFLISGGVAMAQFWPDYTKIGLVLGIFVVGQIIEGNVLTPNIVGNKVRLHPVWLLFALIASGYLLGFTGLLISVPLAAAIGVLVRHAVRRYYESEIYDGEGGKEQKTPAVITQ
jgi:predicted PurR-regulated permease PerM